MFYFRSRTRIAYTLLASALVAALSGCGKTESHSTQAPRSGIAVRVAQANIEDVPHLLHAVGTVEPLQSVVVRAQVDGTLTALHFEEGEEVEAGQLLATIDDRILQATLRSAQADLASNQARLRSAEADLERYMNLAKRNAVSKQILDQQVSIVEQLKADVLRNEASIEDAQVRLSYTQVVSPVSGRVGLRKVDVGNLVRSGDAEGIVAVTQTHPISALFSVSQNHLPALRAEMAKAHSTPVTAIDRDSGKELAQGPILSIDNSIRAGSGTVRLRVLFANDDEALWPGQFVSLMVPVGVSQKVVTVPSVAVRLGLESPFVYRLEANGTVSIAPVRTGYRGNGITVITEGLNAGDTVVTDGFVRLRDGVKVSVQQPAAASQGDAQ